MTTKQAYSDDPRFKGEDLESIGFGFENPVPPALRGIPVMLMALGDLRSHLLVATDPAFITSDNPVFRYNQYCERIEYPGLAGPLCRGFQIAEHHKSGIMFSFNVAPRPDQAA
jgi:hypothetical protein